MIKPQCLAVLVLAALGMPGLGVAADEAAGMVKTSHGEVLIERAGRALPAAVGTPVLSGDKVRTGRDGSVGITLRDETLLSAGPNASLSIDKFAFDSTTHGGALGATLRKGTLAVATGKLAKQAPESVEFRTPTTILGVRGTEFVVEIVGGED